MNLVLHGTTQCQVCPGPLSSPSRRKCPSRWCQRKGSVCGPFFGPLPPLSPHSPLCPQPEVPGCNSHKVSSTSQQPRPWPWPQVHGHRHYCSKEVTAHGSQDQPAHQRGHTTDIPYPVAHVSDKLQETTHKLSLCWLPDLVLLVKKQNKTKTKKSS